MEQEKSDIPEAEKPVKRFKINNRTVAILVLVLIVVFLVGGDPYFRRKRLESRACLILRSTGSSQLAYHGTNNHKHYGTFEDLEDNNYVAVGYNLVNMIEGYALDWEIALPFDHGISGCGSYSFTIVAYPFFSYPPKLRTFGITEDQVVRVYNPQMGSKFNGREDPDILTWDIILNQ